jgi:hypothetical protein
MWFALAAFATGALITGVVANQNSGGSSHDRICAEHYRSCRSSDNSWQPNSGPRQQCNYSTIFPQRPKGPRRRRRGFLRSPGGGLTASLSAEQTLRWLTHQAGCAKCIVNHLANACRGTAWTVSMRLFRRFATHWPRLFRRNIYAHGRACSGLGGGGLELRPISSVPACKTPKGRDVACRRDSDVQHERRGMA